MRPVHHASMEENKDFKNISASKVDSISITSNGIQTSYPCGDLNPDKNGANKTCTSNSELFFLMINALIN